MKPSKYILGLLICLTKKIKKNTSGNKRVFGSVIVVVFQIAFRAEIHANNFFHFLKIIFGISTSKQSKKYKLYLILIK
jgi:hypothetical protein